MKHLRRRQRPSGRASAAARPTPRSSASWRNVLKQSSGCARRNFLFAGRSWKYREVRYFFLLNNLDLKGQNSSSRKVDLWNGQRCVHLFALLGKIALERERLEAERRERERRFELESQERQVILDLLKEKVLKGWKGRPLTPAFSGCYLIIVAWRVTWWEKKIGRLFDQEKGKRRTEEWRGAYTGGSNVDLNHRTWEEGKVLRFLARKPGKTLTSTWFYIAALLSSHSKTCQSTSVASASQKGGI